MRAVETPALLPQMQDLIASPRRELDVDRPASRQISCGRFLGRGLCRPQGGEYRMNPIGHDLLFSGRHHISGDRNAGLPGVLSATTSTGAIEKNPRLGRVQLTGEFRAGDAERGGAIVNLHIRAFLARSRLGMGSGAVRLSKRLRR
jgi:hypothetical protein